MANKFLNGIEVSSPAVVDGGSLSTGSTILDIQGSQGQLFSVTNSLVGDLFSVSDISGVPILNVNSSGDITLDGNVYMPDAGKLNFGNSNDLQIYHDGSASYISEVGTGDLIISADNDLTFKDGSGNIMANMNASNSVELMYGNSRKFETSNTGITITGNISAITASGHDFMLGNSNNTSTADTSGFRMHQSATYDDGRYAHRFRKYDHGGGIPLYIDGSGSTANIFTALARFGTYTDEGKTFEVFGTMGATNFSGSSSGTNTGDQTLPTDFVVKSTGGTFDGNLSINIADTGSAPAMTALFNIRGYEGRGAGIKIKDSANSAADASNREWFIGSGYSQSGFNIGYSATGSQSSYTAQNKFALSTDGNAIFAGTVTANGTQLTGNQTLPTDFVSAANGGTFGGNLTIKHPSSPTLTLTDDSPDPDNIGTIRASNNYMDFGLDSAEGVTSSRMRFLIDGASAVEFLPNTTYFKQTNIHFQDVSVPQFNFRKDAAIGAGSDIGKINFAATNDDGANYTTGGNIIVEGDGSGWDLSDSSVLNAPTRIKIQLRNSSGALQNAIMLSSNLNANFYGDISAAGDVTANGVTLTGDQTLPSDFVSAANGGTFAGDLLVSKDSPLLTLKNTTDEHTNGGAESKIVFKDHADNSLGKIEVSHNGTNDNALGNMYFQTSNGSTILTALELNSSQNATFASDVTVTGDLTVNGTTTTLNTATVEVEDNILQLNTTQGTPDTATAATSGISIYRGVDENDVAITQASLIFDEADDTWEQII